MSIILSIDANTEIARVNIDNRATLITVNDKVVSNKSARPLYAIRIMDLLFELKQWAVGWGRPIVIKSNSHIELTKDEAIKIDGDLIWCRMYYEGRDSPEPADALELFLDMKAMLKQAIVFDKNTRNTSKL